jgi:tetratricopeptide (TPR) repeat protein
MKKYLLPLKILFLLSVLTVSSCQLFDTTKEYQELNRLIKAGNAAYGAKQYDQSIKFYDEGLRIAPTDAAFLANKSLALRMRATDRYDASMRKFDKATYDIVKNEIKQDLQQSVELANESIKQINKGTWIPIIESENIESIKVIAFLSRAAGLRLLVWAGDKSKADEALKAIDEYIEIEPDKNNRLSMRLNAGEMMIEVSRGSDAVKEYKKILDSDPDNIEALLGTGKALAQMGSEERLVESKKYLNHFLKLAPDNHPQISVAMEILRSLENIKPKNKN